MNSVFVVQHFHDLPDETQDVKFIGAYRSAEAARAAVQRLRAKPGFCDYPRIIDPATDGAASGFYIDEYQLDHDCWSEGFISA